MVYRTKTGPGCSTLVVLTLILPVAGLACLVLGKAMAGLILFTTGLALVAAPLFLVVFLMGWPVEYDGEADRMVSQSCSSAVDVNFATEFRSLR